MTNLVDLLLLVLASGGILQLWFTADIFATPRARVEAYQNEADPDSWEALLWDLLLCPVCLGVHVAILLVVVLTIAAQCAPPYTYLGRGIVLVFAVARLERLIDQALPPRMQHKMDFAAGTDHVDGSESEQPGADPVA